MPSSAPEDFSFSAFHLSIHFSKLRKRDLVEVRPISSQSQPVASPRTPSKTFRKPYGLNAGTSSLLSFSMMRRNSCSERPAGSRISGVQVREGRSQIALDEPVPPDPDDARRCVLWGVDRNMGVQVRIARMLRAPFFAGILLVGVAHDRRVARRDGRADARQSRGGGVAGIQDIGATFQILGEAPRLFGRVGLGWRHDLLALAFVKSRRPFGGGGGGGAFCRLEDEAEGGGSALLVTVSKPWGPGRVVLAKVGERGARRRFLNGRRGDAETLFVVRVADGAREADPLLVSCAAFDLQTRPGRGGMPAQALFGEGKERIVAGSDGVGGQGEVELEVLEGDGGRRRGGRASPTGGFRGDSRG